MRNNYQMISLCTWGILILLMSIIFFTPVPVLAEEKSITFSFPDFSDAANNELLQINYNAGIIPSGSSHILRLAPSREGQKGSAFCKRLVSLEGKQSFSTYFTFNINNSQNGGADGLAFLLQTQANNAGDSGMGMGYEGIAPSVAVEFDTWKNKEISESNGNHVGVSINGNIRSVAMAGPSWTMDSGITLHVWIEYNGETGYLEVRMNNTKQRPTNALLRYQIDLTAIIGGQVYTGFTASTGWAYSNHDILSWYFTNRYDPIDPDYEYIQAPTSVTLSADPEIDTNVTTITALVKDNQGNPVANWPVDFITSLGGDIVSSVTDDEGKAYAEFAYSGIPPCTTEITAIAEGGAYEKTSVTFRGVFSGGDGTADNPYLITTAEQIDYIRENLADHYKLAGDIDLGEYESWLPIGDNTNQFAGSFDGSGYAIRNMKINSSFVGTGLFGCVSAEGQIQNVRLENVNVTGTTYTGSLAGRNDGTINNCSALGVVSSSNQYIGGLVGYNQGLISFSWTRVDVSSTKGSVGGIVGYNNGTVSQSFARGNVRGLDKTGGLAGENLKTIEYCYAAGIVISPGSNVGGLIGASFENDVEGLMSLSSVTVLSSYYDSEMSEQTDTGKGIPKTTDEMKLPETYEGWNFSDIWAVRAGINEGYPYLGEQPPKSNNANLANIIPSQGTLEPVFDGNRTEYVVRISGAIDTVSVLATPVNANAHLFITINGEKVTEEEGNFQGNLKPGDNIVIIKVISEDWTSTKTYTVNITDGMPAASNNANLARLFINSGVLNPYFHKDTINYNVVVGYKTETISVIPNPEHPKASVDVTVNGFSVARVGESYRGALNVGENSIVIEVTAEDRKTTKIYTITVTRSEEENSVDISDLIEFDTITPTYRTSVGYQIETVTYTPPHYSETTVTVDGSPGIWVGPYFQMPIDEGKENTTIIITIREEDGTTKTYTIVLTRERASNNANLESLLLNKGEVAFEFSKETTQYKITVPDKLKDITVTAKPEDPKASLVVNEQAVAYGEESQPLVLNYGQNTINILVTAEDGTEKTYTVNINKKRKKSAKPPVEIKIMGMEYNSIISTIEAVGGYGEKHIKVGINKFGEKLSRILDVQNLRDRNPLLIEIIATEKCQEFITELSGLQEPVIRDQNIIIRYQTPEAVFTIPFCELEIIKTIPIVPENKQSDIKLNLQIAKPSQEFLQKFAEQSKDKKYKILTTPLQFEITYTKDGKTQEIPRYKHYLEQTIKMPSEVNLADITTAVAIDTAGNISHVPTKVKKEDTNTGSTGNTGNTCVEINSLTGGTYTIIKHQKKFSDVQNHWAEEVINLLGSKLIIGGIDAHNFAPQRAITRCEFAALLNRALGLKELPGSSPQFIDITEKDWYCKAVKICAQYGLVGGYPDGSFQPQNNITREEAMAVLVRAMKLAGMDPGLKEGELQKQLSRFRDNEKVSEWAQESVAVNVKYGIIVGRDELLAPQDKITRAEAAAIIARVLEKSDEVQ